MKQLLLATNNQGKVDELRGMLGWIDVEVVSLADIGITTEVEETGDTFIENAKLKASGYASLAGIAAIADDSGLEVDALGQRPGVLSARYGGPATSFAEKMQLLLDEIEKTGNNERRARFVCSIAVADRDGNILQTADGICEGKIAKHARGSGGFGYDPVFIPDGYDETFGELSGSVKSKISHRSRAFDEIMPFLLHFIAN